MDEDERRRPARWRGTLLLLGVALVLSLLVRALLVQAFFIPSASMEPLLAVHDRIVVQKVSYWRGTPQRGDVVVFADPGGWLPASESGAASGLDRVLETVGLRPAGGHLVKRVIGVGGDEVRCCDARGRLTVDGRALHESAYLPRGTKPSTERFDVRVPAGSLWVMGDNRGDSADSRAHLGDPGGGMVGTDLVVGKVLGIVWPLDRVGLLHRPAT